MKSILESHPVTVLKKEISKTNIKGYSKMKKDEVVKLMLKHESRFKHIKMAEKKPVVKKVVKAVKKEEKKEVKKEVKKEDKKEVKKKPTKPIKKKEMEDKKKMDEEARIDRERQEYYAKLQKEMDDDIQRKFDAKEQSRRNIVEEKLNLLLKNQSTLSKAEVLKKAKQISKLQDYKLLNETQKNTVKKLLEMNKKKK